MSHLGQSAWCIELARPRERGLKPERGAERAAAERSGAALLTSTAVASLANPLANHKQKALSLFEKGPLALVAGEGFEPSTSGL